MSDITITTLDNNKIALASPYNDQMPPKARALGGRWNRDQAAWIFDARDEQRVRDLAREIYGTDGSPEDTADLVTVRIKLADHEVSFRDGGRAEFAGRIIAERRARDCDVRLADNVILIAGKLAGRGGSVRYPEIDAADDVVVEIRDIPRAALSVEDDDSYQIVEQATDTEALRTERARLLERLAEIDAALAAAGEPAAEEPQPKAHAVPAAPTATGVITVRVDTCLDDISGATTTAFAAAAGISVRTARRWAASGRINAQRVGRRWIITA